MDLPCYDEVRQLKLPHSPHHCFRVPVSDAHGETNESSVKHVGQGRRHGIIEGHEARRSPEANRQTRCFFLEVCCGKLESPSESDAGSSDSSCTDLKEYFAEEIDVGAEIAKEKKAKAEKKLAYPTHTHADVRKVMIQNGYRVTFKKKPVGRITAWRDNLSCNCLLHAKCTLPASKIKGGSQ